MKLKKAGIITKIVVFALIIYASVTLIGLRNRIVDERSQQDALRRQATELEVHNAELGYAIDNSDDDDVIADVARDELGLVGAGEKVFYDSDN